MLQVASIESIRVDKATATQRTERIHCMPWVYREAVARYQTAYAVDTTDSYSVSGRPPVLPQI